MSGRRGVGSKADPTAGDTHRLGAPVFFWGGGGGCRMQSARLEHRAGGGRQGRAGLGWADGAGGVKLSLLRAVTVAGRLFRGSRAPCAAPRRDPRLRALPARLARINSI